MAGGDAQTAKWGKWRVLRYALLIVGTYILAQIGALIGIGIAEGSVDAAVKLQNDGFVISVCAIAAALACVPLMGFLASRRESEPWSYLGVRPCRRQSLVLWCLAMLAFLACTDLSSLALGRPLVPQFMLDAYGSARYPALLFVALGLAAPLVEELFFRGFLLSSFESLGVPFRVGATLSSLAWAGIHTQYDMYDVTLTFAMGLLLAEARYRSRSVVPCIAMHSVNNVGSFIETALLATP